MAKERTRVGSVRILPRFHSYHGIRNPDEDMNGVYGILLSVYAATQQVGGGQLLGVDLFIVFTYCTCSEDLLWRS